MSHTNTYILLQQDALDLALEVILHWSTETEINDRALRQAMRAYRLIVEHDRLDCHATDDASRYIANRYLGEGKWMWANGRECAVLPDKSIGVDLTAEFPFLMNANDLRASEIDENQARYSDGTEG